MDPIPNTKSNTTSNTTTGEVPKVLRSRVKCEDLYFYQKTVILYQITFEFCGRFLPKYGDRTVDQMVQAARSGKQNIVEGSADGITSTEMELKLLNVARASIQELREDYEDYLMSRHLSFWKYDHPRYDSLIKFCRAHNQLTDYEPFFSKWTDEEMANTAVTLCHMVDKMMMTYIKRLETQFVTEGGIKERMYKARTGYRQAQDLRLAELEKENAYLKELLRKNGIPF